MSRGFWLSHHPEEELHRTYRLAGHAVCARCLGVYPTMLLAIALQLGAGAPLVWQWDGPWTVGALLPAVADWTAGRLAPERGGNLWRTLTGVFAGLALGRSLYVHLQKPFPVWLLVQVTLVILAVVAVILVTYARRTAR